MKRTLRYGTVALVLLLGCALLLPACRERKIRSLSKMLREEKANIERFIQEKGLKVQEATEGQTTFEEGVYYHFSNNLYMRVIDKGTTRAIPGKTHVTVRFKGYLFSEEKHTAFDNLSNANFQNTEILYVEAYERGALHYQLLPPSPGSNLNSLMCEGMAFPLSLVGDGAKVSLIVPFLIGPEKAYNAGITIFCEEVRYQFFVK